MSTPALVALAEVEAAARRLAGVAHRTPHATSRTLDAATGARVVVKCENLQRVGAFKFRGAYNAIAQLTDAERAAGVVSFSSGNHAQAVALAGSLLGCRTTIVMPDNAPRAKIEATRGYGAEVVLYTPSEESREAKAEEIRRERGGVVVPPFDDRRIVAGAGTVALEILEDAPGPVAAIVVAVGGGGLISGTAVAARGRAPGCRVVGVEPETGDDARRSKAAGEIVRLAAPPPTIADGLRTTAIGAITFAHIAWGVDEIVTVSDAELAAAMRFYWTRMKLVVEPSGAAPLAALLAGKVRTDKEGAVALVISGGNVDVATACGLLAG